MKKRMLAAALLAAMTIAGCGSGDIPEKNPVEDAPAFEREGELLAASASFMADGRLYFHDNGYLSYLNLAAGTQNVLCTDPLCLHDGDQYIYSECPAITFETDRGQVLVDGGEVWFTAWGYKERADGMADRFLQLHKLDLESGKKTVYLEESEALTLPFWRYAGETYLSLPSEHTDEKGKITQYGGSICRLEKNGSLTVLLEDPDRENWRLAGVDESGLYVSGTSGLYRTGKDFSKLEPVPIEGRGIIRGGYVWWLEMTDEKQTAEGDKPDVEIAEEFSVLDGRGHVFRLMRRKLDGSSEAEELYRPVYGLPSTTAPDPSTFWIDPDSGLVYLVPLELSHLGSLLWEEDNPFIIKNMGLTKPIMTNFYTMTGGRLVELNPETGEARDILTGSGADIVNLYGVKDGKVYAEFKLYEPDRLKELKKEGQAQGSRMDYRWKGSMEVTP